MLASVSIDQSTPYRICPHSLVSLVLQVPCYFICVHFVGICSRTKRIWLGQKAVVLIKLFLFESKCNMDKLSIRCKLQLFGINIYIYIERERKRHNSILCVVVCAGCCPRPTRFQTWCLWVRYKPNVLQTSFKVVLRAAFCIQKSSYSWNKILIC